VALRFLSWCLLGRRIQQNTHNSIEDATASLDLYMLHERARAAPVGPNGDEWSLILRQLDDVGRRLHWQTPNEEPEAASNSAAVAAAAAASTAQAPALPKQ